MQLIVYQNGLLVCENRVFRCALGRSGITSNKIEGDEALEGLTQLPALKTLNLRYNKISKIAPLRELLKLEELDFSGYDLILSCSHCVAKSIRTPPGAVHVCYIFTPMRYIWDMMHSYFGGWKRLALPFLMPWIRGLRRRDQEYG